MGASPEANPVLYNSSRTGAERLARVGDSPVGETVIEGRSSSAGPEKSRVKMGGPPSKAKYSQMTDSEPVP